MLALFVAACGTSTDEPGADIPDFVGAPGAGPAAAPGAEDPAAPGVTDPATTPNGSAGAGSAAPGGPASGNEGPGAEVPLDTPPGAAGASGQAPTAETPETPVAPVTPGEPLPEQPEQPLPTQPPSPDRPTRGTANLFTELLGIPVGDVDAKVRTAVNRVFGIGTGESATPDANTGYRIYYELPQDQSKAFIWNADEGQVRSEGQSYGMIIAVQMNMQTEFDKLWKFAKEEMQITSNDAWNRYFRWQGFVQVTANAINIDFANNGPAPDGDEYFAAALYLADRRWGSAGATNYEQEADAIASAMLNNTGAGGAGLTPIINPQSNMVVFYPQGNSAGFSDPSYHLPAFYELFAQDGNPGDANRWRQVANVSRQYFVQSANQATGLHPDYANFDGTPQTGGAGQTHDQFRYDAWRVPMNMAIDYAWTGPDARLQAQVNKYHAFFTNNGHLGQNNVNNSLFFLNGQVSGDPGATSTALTATLASAALASSAENRADFVQALWNVGQQSGFYRYYQESVYLLGLLATAGWFGYEWAPAP